MSFAKSVTDVAVDSNNGIYPTKLFDGSDNTLEKSYITLAKTKFESTEFTKIEETNNENYIEGYNTYKFTAMKLDFSWGSMFGSNSPCTFYNNPSSVPTNNKEKLQYMEKANKTLQKMYNDLNKTITLTLTADVQSTSTGR